MSKSGNVARTLARTTAETLVTGGVVVLLFAVYLVFWSDVQTAAAQVDLRDDFKQQVAAAPVTNSSAPPAPVRPSAGSGVAVMKIPRLGDDWSWVVVEGVTNEQLARGPGRFPETALPGQVGNFAVAGHRATHGEPFAHIDRVRKGDKIIVEAIGSTYTYVVTSTQIVPPTEVGVLYSVPGKPNARPRKARITIVTCHPRWGSSERLIVHGKLAETRTGKEA
ncbi:class E sortase [Mumia zhuanghuii]|uniref:Class E sortase n=1 Tax=Mumia zhuanghuii TaxID=2585211 RepID=A0A5C4MJN7_9ACTN|nr:class E sortase [Mumia zhuanghuii]TNC45336.1 class E sortase [Mumia zhuanghuii]